LVPPKTICRNTELQTSCGHYRTEVNEVSLVDGWIAPDGALPVAQLFPGLKCYNFLQKRLTKHHTLPSLNRDYRRFWKLPLRLLPPCFILLLFQPPFPRFPRKRLLFDRRLLLLLR